MVAELVVDGLMSSSQFGKFIADETEKWSKVVQATGMKAE